MNNTALVKSSKTIKGSTSAVRSHLDAVERARELYLATIRWAEADYFDRIKRATDLLTALVMRQDACADAGALERTDDVQQVGVVALFGGRRTEGLEALIGVVPWVEAGAPALVRKWRIGDDVVECLEGSRLRRSCDGPDWPALGSLEQPADVDGGKRGVAGASFSIQVGKPVLPVAFDMRHHV
jgi:hypothetical protein